MTYNEVTVSAASDRYHPDDERWLAQVRELWAEAEGLHGYRVRSRPVPDTRGLVDTIVLVLGSASAINAAQQCFRQWLQRDKSRRVEFTINGYTASVAADTVDAATFRGIVETLLRNAGRLGGGTP